MPTAEQALLGARYAAMWFPLDRNLRKAPANVVVLAGVHLPPALGLKVLKEARVWDHHNIDFLLASARAEAVLGRSLEAVGDYRKARALVPLKYPFPSLAEVVPVKLLPDVQTDGQEK